MAYIELSPDTNYGKKIMIFAEGTVLKPKTILLQYSYKSYIPIGKSVSLIERWYSQGADIVYCTFHKDPRKINDTARMLTEFGFKGSRLYYRGENQQYKDVVEIVYPDILIEDDCYSIGGTKEMCITNTPPYLKDKIKSIVVKEFKGIDLLSPNYLDL